MGVSSSKGQGELAHTLIFTLTPKGQRSFFSKNGSNMPFLAQEAQTKK
jgi:hypothetical protein